FYSHLYLPLLPFHSFPSRRSSDLVFSILFIYPVIFRCWRVHRPVPRYIWGIVAVSLAAQLGTAPVVIYKFAYSPVCFLPANLIRSEEHTSVLQSRLDLLCRLLLE